MMAFKGYVQNPEVNINVCMNAAYCVRYSMAGE